MEDVTVWRCVGVEDFTVWTYSLSLQVAVHLLHVGVSVAVNRTPMDVITKTPV